jgi:hypothetical protein
VLSSLGCPDPPLEYSVIRADVVGLELTNCRVSRTTHLLVSPSSNEDAARLQCTLLDKGLPLDVLTGSHKPEPLPENAVVTRCMPRRLEFYLDNGSFCDQFAINFYQVPATEMPPAWWPCP